MWRAPVARMTTSPGPSRTAGSPLPGSSTQHDPDSTAWKPITCSESGMMRPAISPTGGVWATQGAVASTSKNMAPVSRTARRTSDKISMPLPPRRRTRGWARRADGRSRPGSWTIG
jgi:hypothetical protein